MGRFVVINRKLYACLGVRHGAPLSPAIVCFVLFSDEAAFEGGSARNGDQTVCRCFVVVLRDSARVLLIPCMI